MHYVGGSAGLTFLPIPQSDPRMHRRLLILVSLLACLLVPARAAYAAPNACGIPTGYSTLWVDFADGPVPFWQDTFARPGVIAAAANQIVPPQLRAKGALSAYWDMYLNNRVGTPSAPADPATIVARANKLYDYAAASTGCATPWIAENELFGAGLTTPWSGTNAQYRQNVLLYLQTLASRGARPFLLVNSKPYTASADAADWWKQVAAVSDIVREVYFPAPAIWSQGPVQGQRSLRVAFRRALTDFTDLGIPGSKLGLMLGFQTERGQGGREGLERTAWLQTVKWQALSARQVAADVRNATIWSWGWANWGTRELDPDKQAAACVYLWTRAHSLCDGPAAAGEGFNASLTDGQIRMPVGLQCTIAGRRIAAAELAPLQALTGDRELAYSALLERSVESQVAPISTDRVLAAERVVVTTRFAGSASAYLAALHAAHATQAVARGVIADQLRRSQLEAGLKARTPSAAEVATFYLSYGDLLARPVQASPAPWWLGGRAQGLALSALAPPALFDLHGGVATVLTMEGSYRVTPLGAAQPLGALPLAQARPAIEAALRTFSRGAAFESWTVTQQSAALKTALCARDDYPQPAPVDLSTFLPFLALTV